MNQSVRQPKLLFPSLRPLYDALDPLSWLLVRCAAGLILAVHGWGKVANGLDAMAPTFVKLGYSNPMLVIYLLILVELIGGICLALGLFTRFFAAMITIELGWIFFHHYLANGFSWTHRGYEYVLLWGLVSLAIWWRGGGPWSVDRLIGKEL